MGNGGCGESQRCGTNWLGQLKTRGIGHSIDTQADARKARFIIELKYVWLKLFRFPEWSEAKKLPKEVLLFCRNVLHYLGKNDKDFIHEDWGGLEDNDDDEDDYDENDYTRYDH